MRRTLEAVFRHPLQLLALIVFLPIVGVGVAYLMVPRTYQATASIWALHRYETIGATGPESDTLSTPAQTQATALTELLQTRSFVSLIVKGIDLGPTIGLSGSIMNDPQQLQDAYFNEISKHVIPTPSAYNLLEISYTNRNPQIAQQIIESVITNYGTQSLGLSIANGQNLLAVYQTELTTAQNNLNNAVTTETQYIRSHSNLTLNQLVNDPQYALIDAQKVQAQANVQNLQNTINTIQQSIGTVGSNPNSLFKVVDIPQVSNRPVSRSKDYLVAGGGGLAIGLLACMIYLIILVRRDRGIYSDSDLQRAVAIPAIMQLPILTKETISLLITSSINNSILLLSDKSQTKK